MIPSGGGLEREVTFAPEAHGPMTLLGGDGSDRLELISWDGSVDGQAGPDLITPAIGESTIYDGGAGIDRIVYDGSVIHVYGTGAGSAIVQQSPSGGQDTLQGMEVVEGSGGPDVFNSSSAGGHFVGGGESDVFFGAAGVDRFVGGPGGDLFEPFGGDDVVRGGEGTDFLSTNDSPGPVTFDLTNAVSTGEGTDHYRDIELIQGSQHDDVFAGDALASGLYLIIGNGGRDLLDLRSAAQGQAVFTSPVQPTAVPSWVTFSTEDIRRVLGSPFHDRIEVGDVNGFELRGHFFGFGGNDRLTGGAHHDVLDGGAGDDRLNGQGGRDICDGGPGDDVVLNCEV
jgi:Ca2+-binding RTX toxin-like protein